jgi:hypothetical protein
VTDLMERVLSAATMRTIIRQKCCAGVSGETISRLIAAYVRPETVAQYEDKPRPGRIPVELIPADRRVAFVEALQRLPVSRSFAGNKIAALRPQIARAYLGCAAAG